MKERLAQVKTPGDFEKAKKDICEIIRDCYMRLRRREWESLSDLAFNVVLGEELERYTKTTPQHVKAARILKGEGVELRAGDLISFVKVISEPYGKQLELAKENGIPKLQANKKQRITVKPVELATKNEIDVDKYIAYLRSTFDQVLDALGLDFDEIIGLTKLERFM
jgi:DNA polymerase I